MAWLGVSPHQMADGIRLTTSMGSAEITINNQYSYVMSHLAEIPSPRYYCN